MEMSLGRRSSSFAAAAGRPILTDRTTTTAEAARPGVPVLPCVGGPVVLATAPNGTTANKRILDGVAKAGWREPTIEELVEGI